MLWNQKIEWVSNWQFFLKKKKKRRKKSHICDFPFVIYPEIQLKYTNSIQKKNMLSHLEEKIIDNCRSKKKAIKNSEVKTFTKMYKIRKSRESPCPRKFLPLKYFGWNSTTLSFTIQRIMILEMSSLITKLKSNNCVVSADDLILLFLNQFHIFK